MDHWCQINRSRWFWQQYLYKPRSFEVPKWTWTIHWWGHVEADNSLRIFSFGKIKVRGEKSSQRSEDRNLEVIWSIQRNKKRGARSLTLEFDALEYCGSQAFKRDEVPKPWSVEGPKWIWTVDLWGSTRHHIKHFGNFSSKDCVSCESKSPKGMKPKVPNHPRVEVEKGS